MSVHIVYCFLVPGWICFVPLKLFLYETDPFVCFFVFVVYNLKHTVHFSQPKMSQNLYFVPLVAHHEWICFVLLKLFLYQAGTKKVSIVRNPFESFESSEKLGG